MICRIRSAGGDSEALLEAAAHLYQLQARFDLTLAILLRLKRQSVFDFMRSHHLLPMLKESSIAQLISIDQQKAIELFVDCREEIPTQTVVPAFQVSGSRWESLENSSTCKVPTYLCMQY